MKKKTIYKILTAIFTAVLTALPFTVAKQKKNNTNVTLTAFDTWEQLNGDNMYYDFLTEVLDIQFSKTQTTEPEGNIYTFVSDDLMILRLVEKNTGNNYVDISYGFMNGGYNNIDIFSVTNNSIFVGVGSFFIDITQYEGVGTLHFKLYRVKNIAQMLATAQSLGYTNGYTSGYGDGVNIGGGLTPEDVNNAYTSGYNTGFSAGLTDGYDNGYTNGYDNGYTKGNNDGYGLGLSQGYNDGLTDGYNNGYNDGVAYTINETDASMNFLQTFFNTIWQIINTKILGFISIGTILLFVLGMGVVGLLFKLLKG